MTYWAMRCCWLSKFSQVARALLDRTIDESVAQFEKFLVKVIRGQHPSCGIDF